jgi:hypothetical protein
LDARRFERRSVRKNGNAFFQIESVPLHIKPYLLGKPLPGSATAGQGRKPRSGGVARASLEGMALVRPARLQAWKSPNFATRRIVVLTFCRD